MRIVENIIPKRIRINLLIHRGSLLILTYNRNHHFEKNRNKFKANGEIISYIYVN